MPRIIGEEDDMQGVSARVGGREGRKNTGTPCQGGGKEQTDKAFFRRSISTREEWAEED